ncbi:pyridoxine kinase [Ruminococcus sp. YE71]|uniref:pyridoxamine kinase n=1 Tax=unclassified Ruminococcus TaxID=2608920 RepID=UPI00088BFA77|nr:MULTISPECIES: pyridoxamine kinase [unclassified Ruminococcus]SDA18870.1 pyridoxine kinase [Ruminococcus sp. YE78]SFW29076.1 pyridoxine kinase [Ruminococcus sp. YE71]
MKRLLTIQDISCFGKCSLTAALPVISAMGVETIVLPTAVLSTHTGSGFSGFTFRDLTDDIEGITAHWKRLGLTFNTIYTGYLGSLEQVSIIRKLIADFRTEDTLVVVDPVMGDGGRMYSGFDSKFVTAMKSLCADADVILPNATEAALLLGQNYRNDLTADEIQSMLMRLTALGCGTAIMTGASTDKAHNGAMAYVARTGEFVTASCENISGSFHSTGDIFSSVLSGGMTLGMDMQTALDLAAEFTHDCIKATLPIREEHWYAVRFEPCLGMLAERCRKYIDV